MPLPTTKPPSSRRKVDNPTSDEENNSRAELTCLSVDRTSSSVRDHVVVEGGGESPAPHLCGPTSGARVQILEDIQIVPPRTLMDPHTTPAPKPQRAVPRTVMMLSESPASPDDDEEEFRTPTPTPTREVEYAFETARPAGSAREPASRDASRERATARAADVSALRSRAVVADAPRGAVAPMRAPVGSAAAVSAPRGSASAAVVSRDSTGTPASRLQPPSEQKQKIKSTPTPPGVPQNTPTTPATTVPARYRPISRSQTEMRPPQPQLQQRSRSISRQSERSAGSARSTDTTPERSGSRSSLGPPPPPLSEPRALVSTPTPGFGPSAPTPFASSSNAGVTAETPRTSKRAREEGYSDKAKPAVRPRIHHSPASQATSTEDVTPPTLSYAEQVRTTRTDQNKNEADPPPKIRRRGGKGRGKKNARTGEEGPQPKPQPKPQPTATNATAASVATMPPVVAPPPPPPTRPSEVIIVEAEVHAPPATAIPIAATTPAATSASTTLTHEPVVAALHQGTKAKPETGYSANEAVRETLIGVLQEVTSDLQRGADLMSLFTTVFRGLLRLVTLWKM
ncbi:hypothetical protein ACJJTC_002990 [Scirpophaga incertulas]